MVSSRQIQRFIDTIVNDPGANPFFFVAAGREGLTPKQLQYVKLELEYEWSGLPPERRSVAIARDIQDKTPQELIEYAASLRVKRESHEAYMQTCPPLNAGI